MRWKNCIRAVFTLKCRCTLHRKARPHTERNDIFITIVLTHTQLIPHTQCIVQIHIYRMQVEQGRCSFILLFVSSILIQSSFATRSTTTLTCNSFRLCVSLWKRAVNTQQASRISMKAQPTWLSIFFNTKSICLIREATNKTFYLHQWWIY